MKVTREKFRDMLIQKTLKNAENLVIDNGNTPHELFIGENKTISQIREEIHMIEYTIFRGSVLIGFGRDYSPTHPDFYRCKELLIKTKIWEEI